jgi:hypothetical protein
VQLVRCAIYTRKSSEEGLEQEFNSLDAQREAGEAFVRSQAGEGWALVGERYDDGGYTGGNTDRPGFQRLLADIEAGKIDVVVVYKVDRLSRSLLDFAQMMRTFERYPNTRSASSAVRNRTTARALESWAGTSGPRSQLNATVRSERRWTQSLEIRLAPSSQVVSSAWSSNTSAWNR